MRKAKVFMHGKLAGYLFEVDKGKKYQFTYADDYDGPPISLTMPTRQRNWEFQSFPPFFEGLLPEGFQLDALLRKQKIDRDDLFSQIVTVGQDLVGAITVSEAEPEEEGKNE